MHLLDIRICNSRDDAGMGGFWIASGDHILNVATSHNAGLCDGGQPANTNQMTGPRSEVSRCIWPAFSVLSRMLEAISCLERAVCVPRMESLGESPRATAHFIVEMSAQERRR